MTRTNTTDVAAWTCDKIGEPVGDDTISDTYVHKWCAEYEPATEGY